jgi:hypothetical protein
MRVTNGSLMPSTDAASDQTHCVPRTHITPPSAEPPVPPVPPVPPMLTLGDASGAAIGNGGLGQPTIHSGSSTLPRRRIKRRAAPHACTASEGHSRAHCSCERAPRRQRVAHAQRKRSCTQAWSTCSMEHRRSGGRANRRRKPSPSELAVGLARKQGELTSHLQGARGDQRSAQSRLFGIVRMKEHAGARTCRCVQP